MMDDILMVSHLQDFIHSSTQQREPFKRQSMDGAQDSVALCRLRLERRPGQGRVGALVGVSEQFVLTCAPPNVAGFCTYCRGLR